MQNNNALDNWAPTFSVGIPRRFIIGLILMVALLAFEVFNFDTTQYALENLLGNISFIGVPWATVLAIAFCSIDFAGLARFFLPSDQYEPKEVWYLVGAWLLGATMNAMMTWWAVTLTLLNHDLGNEIMSREELITVVPIFVAVLVWLTRILFIGGFSALSDDFFATSKSRVREMDTAYAPQFMANAPRPDYPMRHAPTVAMPTVAAEAIEAYEPGHSGVPAHLRRRANAERTVRRPATNGSTYSPQRTPVPMMAKGSGQ